MCLRLVLLVLLPFLFIACSKSNQSDSAILGGQTVPQESDIAQSTVALGFYKNGKFKADCTGTVVSNDIILTAAHCVKSYEMNDSDVIVYFGNEYKTYNESLERSTISWIYHPGYEAVQDQNGQFLTAYNDVAVVKIQGGIPSGFKPAALIGAEREIPTNSEIIIAGWGATSDDPIIYSSSLQSTTVTLSKYWNTHLITDQRNQKGACFGDSGGPAYVYNKTHDLTVIGLTRGPHDQVYNCSEFGEYTSITANLDFILESIRDLNGTNPVIDENIGQVANDSKKMENLSASGNINTGVSLLNTPTTELKMSLKCVSEVF